MALTTGLKINWLTKVITIPIIDLTHDSGTLYLLNTNDLRKWLKDIEDSEEGIAYLDTHRHNTEVTVAGITYARTIEIINGYSITFEDGQYSVILSGSNNNVWDIANGILNQNQVQVIPTNSAGLQTVVSGSGVTEQDKTDIATAVWADSDATFITKMITNKKSLEKNGSVWELIIYDDDDSTPLLNKTLKDKDGNNITDLEAGVMATELQTSV